MDTCEKCGGPMKFVPAGVSKNTGRQYNAFHACEDRSCGNKVSTGFGPKKIAPKAPEATDKDRSIIRQTCIKASCELFAGVNGSTTAVISAAKEFEAWILQANNS